VRHDRLINAAVAASFGTRRRVARLPAIWPLLGAKQTPASDSAITILRAHVLGDRENGRQIRPACGCTRRIISCRCEV